MYIVHIQNSETAIVALVEAGCGYDAQKYAIAEAFTQGKLRSREGLNISYNCLDIYVNLTSGEPVELYERVKNDDSVQW